MRRALAAMLLALTISGVRAISLDEGVYEIHPDGLVLWFTQDNNDGTTAFIQFTGRNVEAR